MTIDWDKQLNAPVMAVFGEQAQFRPLSGSPFNVSVRFHEAYEFVSFSDGVGVSSVAPAAGVRLAEFPAAPKQKDSIAITATSLHGGGTYVVKEVRPNGIGEALLLLNYTGP